MTKHFFFFFIVTFLFSYKVKSQSLEFIENKGQWDNKIKFKGELNTGAFFLTKSGFTVVQHKKEDITRLANFYHHVGTSKEPNSSKELTLRSHAYDVAFENANMSEAVPDDPASSYNNYFIGNDRSKWASECKIFKVITYKNIYPNIDLKYYTEKGYLKYDLIVRPGADLSNLEMKYTGVEALNIENDELVLKTSTGDIKELAPFSYQLVDRKSVPVSCKFKVLGNTVKFEVGKHLEDATLIIDPQLVFSTFTGSTADNWGYSATYGNDGSLYAAGLVFSTGFPVSTGAYQTTFGGGITEGGSIGPHDIGIIKFNAQGTNREYATYLGGSGNEQPEGLIVDPQLFQRMV